MVKKCRNCNQSITANNASFCPTCGEPIPGDNLLLGKYRLIRTLGKGGFGQVYLSEDTQIYDRKCAIKRTNMKEKGFSQEFVEKEAKVLVGLNNAGIPGVPDIYDAFIQDDSFYVVMRFIEGQDLSQRREQADLGWQEIIDWFIQVLDILTYLHNLPMPVIHTDIKPANIIQDEFGKIWLVDFGIAQSKSLSDVPFTANGASVFKDDRTQILSDKAWATLQIPDQDYSPGGSLDYSPWEQWQYRPTAASDVYAAAMSLYYLLIGSEKFKARESASSEFFSPRPGLQFTDEFLSEWPLLLKASLLKATLEQPTERVNARTFRNLLQGCLPSTQTPLKLRDENILTNPGDFVQLANQDWGYALQLVQEESFQAWMETAFEREHRKLSFSAIREKFSVPNALLEAFLQHIDPNLSKPHLAVAPDSIDRIDLYLSTKTSDLFLKNITRGYLPVQLRSSVPWMEVDPPKLTLLGETEKSVNLVIDPEKMPGWRRNLAGEINIRAPSHAISVPIKVRRSLFSAVLQRIIHPLLSFLKAPSAAVGSLFLSFIFMWNYINWAFSEFPQKSDLPITITLGFLPAVGMLSSMIGYWLGSSGAVPASIKRFPNTVGHMFGAGLLLGGGIFTVDLVNRLLEFGQVNRNVYFYSVTCAAIILAILYYAYQRDIIRTAAKVKVSDIIKMSLGVMFAIALFLGFILSVWDFSLADLYQQKPLIPLIVDTVNMVMG